jgi:hypothetical protein
MIFDRVLERFQSRGVLLTFDPLFGQEKCSAKCNSQCFRNGESKLCFKRNKSHTMVTEAYFVPLKPAAKKS